jgi:hypothetical protein
MLMQNQIHTTETSAILAAPTLDLFAAHRTEGEIESEKPRLPMDAGHMGRKKPITYRLSPAQKSILTEASDAKAFEMNNAADQQLLINQASQIARQISPSMGHFADTLRTFAGFLIIEDFPEVCDPRYLIAIAGELFGRVVIPRRPQIRFRAFLNNWCSSEGLQRSVPQLSLATGQGHTLQPSPRSEYWINLATDCPLPVHRNQLRRHL